VESLAVRALPSIAPDRGSYVIRVVDGDGRPVELRDRACSIPERALVEASEVLLDLVGRVPGLVGSG
jgi:hypothetical protein